MTKPQVGVPTLNASGSHSTCKCPNLLNICDCKSKVQVCLDALLACHIRMPGSRMSAHWLLMSTRVC